MLALNYRRYLIAGYLLALMVIASSILLIPGKRYETLTTSDSGWIWAEAKLLERNNGFAEKNPWSHAPHGWEFEKEQLQPLLAVMIYRGVKTVLPSVDLYDIAKYYGIIFFCLSIIPIFLLGRELHGDVAGAVAAFLFTTLVSSIYWNKVGAFDREPTITFMCAWTVYFFVKLMKSGKDGIIPYGILSGITFGLFVLTWAGSMFISVALIGGILFTLAAYFFTELLKKRRSIDLAFKNTVNSHMPLLIGFVIAIVTSTVVFWSGGVSPDRWLGTAQSILGYVGIGGGGGVSFPRYASEMAAPASFSDIFTKFYQNNFLLGITLIGCIVTVLYCIWKREPHHFLLLAWFIVMLAMVWPKAGQARFERQWWPLLPVMAGVGISVILSWLKDFSFHPDWSWLRRFQTPVLAVAIIVLLGSAFVVNATRAAEATTPPTEWRLGAGLDAALMEAFKWIRENTPENAIVSIQWSYGHLLTGATERKTVCDGVEGIGEQGKWENDPNFWPKPPDYVYYVKNNEARLYGVNEPAKPFFINGRRTDVQRFPQIGENELKWYLKTYRDNFGIKIDYILFTYEEYYYAWWNYSVYEPLTIIFKANVRYRPYGLRPSMQDSMYVFNFGGDRREVVLDHQNGRVFLRTENEEKTMDGYAIVVIDESGRPTNMAGFYPPENEAEIPETLVVFLNQTGNIETAWLISGVSEQITSRPEPIGIQAFQDKLNVDFLTQVFKSSNGYVRILQVDHSVID